MIETDRERNSTSYTRLNPNSVVHTPPPTPTHTTSDWLPGPVSTSLGSPPPHPYDWSRPPARTLLREGGLHDVHVGSPYLLLSDHGRLGRGPRQVVIDFRHWCGRSSHPSAVWSRTRFVVSVVCPLPPRTETSHSSSGFPGIHGSGPQSFLGHTEHTDPYGNHDLRAPPYPDERRWDTTRRVVGVRSPGDDNSHLLSYPELSLGCRFVPVQHVRSPILRNGPGNLVLADKSPVGSGNKIVDKNGEKVQERMSGVEDRESGGGTLPVLRVYWGNFHLSCEDETEASLDEEVPDLAGRQSFERRERRWRMATAYRPLVPEGRVVGSHRRLRHPGTHPSFSQGGRVDGSRCVHGIHAPHTEDGRAGAGQDTRGPEDRDITSRVSEPESRGEHRPPRSTPEADSYSHGGAAGPI